MSPTPHTLEQLPSSAASYLLESEKHGIPGAVRRFIGKDYLGRRVYQTFIDGEEYGSPLALLTFREYTKRVKHFAAKVSSSIGVGRFTTPTYVD